MYEDMGLAAAQNLRDAGGAAGNETPDAGLAPARISFGPTRKRGTRTRKLGNGDLSASQSPPPAEPPGLAYGPAGQANS